MACASPELQSQENDYVAALVASTDWSQSGNGVELVDASGLLGQDVTVTLVAATDASYVGSWIVTGYDQGNGSLVAPAGEAELTALFSVDGEIQGSSGCNVYSGPYTVSGSAMTIGPLGTTRMTCSDQLDDQEQRYLDALQLVTNWASDESGIALLAGDGATKVTLAAAR
jgi:heat shock protein HslJ